MKMFVLAMMDALKRLFANKGARMTMVVSILIYACLYPQPYRGEVVRDVPIVAVDQDGSTASREFLRRIHNSDSVEIIATVDGLPAAEAMFFDRKAYGVVIVPPSFEHDLLKGQNAPVAVYGDGGYFLIYGAFVAAANNAAQSLGAEIRQQRLTSVGLDTDAAQTLISPINQTSVALFNPQGGFGSYVVPAAFVLILQQTLLMGIAIMHAGQPARPGIQRVATPAAYILLYLVWIIVTQLALPAIYGIPWIGNIWTLFAVAVPFLIAVNAMGFALTHLIRNRESVVFFLVVQGMPLFFIAGVAWPMESIPWWIAWAAHIVPSTSAIDAFLRVDQMGASVQDVLPTIRLQLALAVGYWCIAYVLHDRQFPKAQGNHLKPADTQTS
ncbi:ABC transporter permease [Shimia sp.]|uniref:ABC transporter permease n=1 Tax=Shimia sp. TaxID=1954381 RepID=UPI003BA9CB4E